MIAVDTNILIYAHRTDVEWHSEALSALLSLAEGKRLWGIPWPCVHEFLAITSHPSIFVPPTPLAEAFRAIGVWLHLPTCRTLGESADHLEALERISVRGKIRGPMVHDARIAAVCLENGVTELWSADRDFSRYKELKVVNPLLPTARKRR
ncbi:MAG: type II toxin-antitoxin system VapC family toxin [bacterium]|nr:type II toxin-antitoxin system VapC family toxin [bacterium]